MSKANQMPGVVHKFCVDYETTNFDEKRTNELSLFVFGISISKHALVINFHLNLSTDSCLDFIYMFPIPRQRKCIK